MSWREFRGTVPVEQALDEYERAKAKLPPGVEPTIDMIEKPWLQRPKRDRPAPARRRRGRSYWTAALFDKRMEQAQRATERPWTDERLAPNFRGLAADGTIGLDPETLRKLRRRREKGQLPPG